MKFAIAIDKDQAEALAPGIDNGETMAAVADGRLTVRLGRLFALDASLDQVAGAAELPDPRPTVFLPLGVSAAVDQLGRDTICAVGSYHGLVRVDFSEDVEGQTRPPDLAGKGQSDEDHGSVRLRHLIVSLEDPAGFIATLRGGT